MNSLILGRLLRDAYADRTPIAAVRMAVWLSRVLEKDCGLLMDDLLESCPRLVQISGKAARHPGLSFISGRDCNWWLIKVSILKHGTTSSSQARNGSSIAIGVWSCRLRSDFAIGGSQKKRS